MPLVFVDQSALPRDTAWEEEVRRMSGITDSPKPQRIQSLREMLSPRGPAATAGGGWKPAVQRWSEGKGWSAGPGWPYNP